MISTGSQSEVYRLSISPDHDSEPSQGISNLPVLVYLFPYKSLFISSPGIIESVYNLKNFACDKAYVHICRRSLEVSSLSHGGDSESETHPRSNP
jgi:hypothetical protein